LSDEVALELFAALLPVLLEDSVWAMRFHLTVQDPEWQPVFGRKHGNDS